MNALRMTPDHMKIGDRFWISEGGFCYLENIQGVQESRQNFKNKLQAYGSEKCSMLHPLDTASFVFRMEHARAGEERQTKSFRWEHFRTGQRYIRRASLQREAPPMMVPIEGPLKELEDIGRLEQEERRIEIKRRNDRDNKRMNARRKREEAEYARQQAAIDTERRRQLQRVLGAANADTFYGVNPVNQISPNRGDAIETRDADVGYRGGSRRPVDPDPRPLGMSMSNMIRAQYDHNQNVSRPAGLIGDPAFVVDRSGPPADQSGWVVFSQDEQP